MKPSTSRSAPPLVMPAGDPARSRENRAGASRLHAVTGAMALRPSVFPAGTPPKSGYRFVSTRNTGGSHGPPSHRQTRHDRRRTHRRYIAGLKAAATQAHAQGSTGLRQENTALRQNVTVLEQELAQQRATAKPRQQAANVPSGKIAKGLGIEALQGGPRSRPRSGVVVSVGMEAQSGGHDRSASAADSTLGSRGGTAVD